MFYTEFETNYYGSDERSLHPGHSVSSLLKIIVDIESEFFDSKDSLTWRYIADGIEILIGGEHAGNIKPVCPTKASVQWLHRMFQKG